LIAQGIEAPVALTRPRTHALGFSVRRVLNYLWGGYREIDPRSQQELMALGILRPATEASLDELETSVNESRLLVVGGLGLLSVVAMYFGAGGYWTWLGCLLFLLSLGAFTWISTSAKVGG
jgi:hypothetical protein